MVDLKENMLQVEKKELDWADSTENMRELMMVV